MHSSKPPFLHSSDHYIALPPLRFPPKIPPKPSLLLRPLPLVQPTGSLLYLVSATLRPSPLSLGSFLSPLSHSSTYEAADRFSTSSVYLFHRSINLISTVGYCIASLRRSCTQRIVKKIGQEPRISVKSSLSPGSSPARYHHSHITFCISRRYWYCCTSTSE